MIEIRVDGDRVVAQWDGRGPWRTLDRDGNVTESLTAPALYEHAEALLLGDGVGAVEGLAVEDAA